MNKIKISACIITYNHEDFIRECLDGALNQIVNCEYEIIIGEDRSSDNTRQICNEYAQKYPALIKVFPRENNLGMIGNWMETIENCSGKYIALCEGDDYWSDPLKLQKQINVLEANPNLVGCFHNSEERYWNDYSKASSLYCSFPAGREVDIKELTKYNMVPTASVVFKSPIPTELFSKTFSRLPVGDWPLHLLNTRNGNYYYLPQVMSVRNLNPQSVWGMQDQEKNVAQVVYVYNELIQSGWFNKEVLDLLKTGCENLENSIKPQKVLEESIFKKKFINILLRVLNKL